MFYELIATVALGFAAAGAGLMARHLSGGRLPRWVVPAAAGIGMIGFQIWSEYDWHARMTAQLPEGVEVISSHADTAFWRPWSYVYPQTTRFAAVDVAGAKTNENVPGQRIVTVLLFERMMPVRAVPQLVDCRNGRRADIADGARFAEDGRIENARWMDLPPDDPMLAALCGGEATG